MAEPHGMSGAATAAAGAGRQPTPAPRSWVAPHEVYTGGALNPAGETFTTDAEPGKRWLPATREGCAAVKAELAEAARALVEALAPAPPKPAKPGASGAGGQNGG